MKSSTANFALAINSLKKPGSVGIIPTDTVYGLIAKATDQAALKRLYSLKERDSKPGTVIAANIEQLETVGLKRRYLMAVKDYWPGPISIVIPCGSELDHLHLGKNGVATRIPKNKGLIDFLKVVGPLLTTSANPPGQPTAATIAEARHYFNDQVDFYVDGGDLSSHSSSTIIRIVDDAIEVIRPGAYKIRQA